MKPVVMTLAAWLVAGPVFGQGGIVLNTRTGGVNAPITDAYTGQRLEGTAYLAQLYYGAAGANESSLAPVLQNPAPSTIGSVAWFGTGPTAGYILTSTGGGNRYTDPVLVAPGALTAFQLRVWDARLGGSWEEAFVAWISGSWEFSLGKSPLIEVPTSGNNLDTPKPLTGLPAFTIGIPEPNVVALGVIGLLAFRCRRRK